MKALKIIGIILLSPLILVLAILAGIFSFVMGFVKGVLAFLATLFFVGAIVALIDVAWHSDWTLFKHCGIAFVGLFAVLFIIMALGLGAKVAFYRITGLAWFEA